MGLLMDESILRSPVSRGEGERYFARVKKFAMSEKYFAYILKSQETGKPYTGFTTDIVNRVRQHNEGIGGFTKGRGPWDLVWYGAFADRQLAENFEKYLKTGSGIAFARKRLMRG